jgi:ribosomal protein S18 acetylase RimI-like enzyme
MTYLIVLDPAPEDSDLRMVKRQLVAFNDQHAEPENYQPLALFVRDPSGSVVGGLLGYTHWRWLFVENLWVAESLRGLGYGKELMRRAECEAFARGCRHAFLDTFGFQALGFYQKLGYEVFGHLEDFPPGHKKYFLQKRQIGDSQPPHSLVSK